MNEESGSDQDPRTAGSSASEGKPNVVPQQLPTSLPAEAPPATEGALPRSRKKAPPWHKRTTVSAYKRDLEEDIARSPGRDEIDNKESQLPAGEKVHLGAIVLTELFTPSTISRLRQSVSSKPWLDFHRVPEVLDEISKNRKGTNGSRYRNLGMVRQVDSFLIGHGYRDPNLPDSIVAVILSLHYTSRSATTLVATFILDDPIGDLSDIFSTEYTTQLTNPKINIAGPFGKIRAKIPWARPRKISGVSEWWDPHSHKKHAVQDRIDELNAMCAKWISAEFPGRFSRERSGERPSVNVVLTTSESLLDPELKWTRALPSARWYAPWRSVQADAWSFESELLDKVHAIATSRRSDAVRKHASGDPNDTWYRIQEFHDEFCSLIAYRGVKFLLDLYLKEIANLRDRSNVPKIKMRRPVGQAIKLDKFIVGDGLDLASIAPELIDLTTDPRGFLPAISPLVMDLAQQTGLPDGHEVPKVPEYLTKSIEGQARQVDRDASVITKSIGTSAQLQQAISGTRTQRWAIILTIFALFVAFASLLVAWLTLRNPPAAPAVVTAVVNTTAQSGTLFLPVEF
jgi:hypothetical protein